MGTFCSGTAYYDITVLATGVSRVGKGILSCGEGDSRSQWGVAERGGTFASVPIHVRVCERGVASLRSPDPYEPEPSRRVKVHQCVTHPRPAFRVQRSRQGPGELGCRAAHAL